MSVRQAGIVTNFANVNVAAGAPTVQELSLTQALGHVTGMVTVDGSPVDEPYFDTIPGGTCSHASSGSFSFFLPTGDYRAVVRQDQIGDPALGSISFSSVAGESFDLGSVAAVAPTARTITGTVLFNGVPFGPTTACSADTTFVMLDGLPPPFGQGSAADVATDGGFTESLGGSNGARVHTIGLFGATAGPPVWSLDGLIADGTFDIAESGSGVVTATIHVNGQPPSQGFIQWGGTPQFSFGTCTDPSGVFRLAHLAGSHTAVVKDGAVVGQLPFQITPGATTDLGLVDFVTNGIQGNVSWGGQSIDSVLGAGSCPLRIYADGNQTYSTPVSLAGTYAFADLPAGSYALSVRQGGTVATLANVIVSTGSPTTADLDLTSILGRVTGTITLDGSPVASPYFDTIPGGTCGSGTTDGSFVLLMPTGSYQAVVRQSQPSSAPLGNFAFAANAGQTNALGTVAASAPTARAVAGNVRFKGASFGPTIDSCSGDTSYVFSEGYMVVPPPGNPGPDPLSGRLRADGTYTAFGTADQGPRQHRLGLLDGLSASPPLGAQDVWTLDGVTTPLDIDITSTAGVVAGKVTFNGSPVSSGLVQYVFTPWGNLGACIASDGTYKFAASPGSYSAVVAAGSGVPPATMLLSVALGQMTNANIEMAQAVVAASTGGQIATGTTATPEDFSVSSVSVPAGAATGDFTLNIAETPSSSPATGYGILGQQIVIEPEGITFSAPVTITFTFDASIVGALPAEDVPIFRNGVLVPDCVVPETYPCVSSRASVAGGDVEVVVLTTQFSVWQSGVANADGDACTDFEELGAVPALGGMRNPNSVHDFYDVNGSKRIDAVDIGLVRANFNPAGPVPLEDAIYDRRLGAATWGPGPPDNKINAVDIGLVRASFNHSCQAAP
jgi:hypothetical protein